MKIFIGCQNTANLASVLTDGFKALGHTAIPFSYTNQHAFFDMNGFHLLDALQYQNIGNQLINKSFEQHGSLGYFEQVSQYLETTISQYLDFDIYIFVNCLSLLPYNLDFPILKEKGKKIISIFSGSEIRYPNYANHMWKTWGFNYPIDKFPITFGSYGGLYTNSLNRKRLNVLLAEMYADLVLSVPEQSGVQTSPYLPYIHTINTEIMKFQNNQRDIPKIVHIPSDKNFKQTSLIEETVMKLKNKGVEFDFQTYFKIPHSQVIEILADADILIDEMSLFPAILSHEAMACGCVVLAGNAKMGLPIPMASYDCPVLNITPDSLEQQMLKVIQDKTLRNDLIQKGKDYIDRYAQPKQAANRILSSLDRYQNKDFDYFPSYAFTQMKYETQDIEFPFLREIQKKVLLQNGYYSLDSLKCMKENNIISADDFLEISKHKSLVYSDVSIEIAPFIHINQKYRDLFQQERQS